MNAKILIVDDEPAARHGLRRALGSGQYEIAEASDGTAALEEVERSAPDLLICDIRAALERHAGNVNQTALSLGLKRQALQQKLRELGIDAQTYRH
ncbi:MAG: response regulator [Candidatus Latescibacteria bacterium]|nr:response regulator [Candidatus Latescibacterota bacterium]